MTFTNRFNTQLWADKSLPKWRPNSLPDWVHFDAHSKTVSAAGMGTQNLKPKAIGACGCGDLQKDPRADVLRKMRKLQH